MIDADKADGRNRSAVRARHPCHLFRRLPAPDHRDSTTSPPGSHAWRSSPMRSSRSATGHCRCCGGRMEAIREMPVFAITAIDTLARRRCVPRRVHARTCGGPRDRRSDAVRCRRGRVQMHAVRRRTGAPRRPRSRRCWQHQFQSRVSVATREVGSGSRRRVTRFAVGAFASEAPEAACPSMSTTSRIATVISMHERL